MYTDEETRILRQFGAQVRALRKARGYSQESFADVIKLHRTYMGGVERGERNLTLLKIIKIAAALQVTPRKLFEAGEEQG